MADNIEHQDKGELVANRDQLQNDEVVVTTPVESRIMSIRGKQIMIDRDLAELYDTKTEYSFLYHAPKTDRHSRKENKFMGETKQTYHFVVTLQELKQRAEK